MKDNMSWRFIDEVLLHDGLHQIPLKALNPDCNEYDVMLYQHGGSVSADANGICNTDHDEAVSKFMALFKLAVQNQPDILVTPEYSCPWSVIEKLIKDNLWPSAGKAWVVGCESIRPDDLEDLRSRHSSVYWLLSSFSCERDQVFLDVVCIFAAATDEANNKVNILVVQAKGCAMADEQHLLEPKSLIVGSDRFILRNDPDSIQMVVFICSDTLEQNILTSLPQTEHLPYIVIHIQLNMDPRHIGFREYRNFWGTYDRHNMEIICLNWARGTELLGKFMQFGGSAWYYKSRDVNASDSEVNNSHRLGAYYTENPKRYFHCHVLNYAEHIFKLRCCKVSQTRSSPPNRLKRIGPQAIALYSWMPSSSIWHIGVADDGFSDCCAVIGADLRPLTDSTLSPVDKERLLCLSIFEIKVHNKPPWPHVRSLRSFEMTIEEVCQRVTFCHDPDRDINERRQKWLNRFSVLKNEILPSRIPFPAHLQKLQTNGQLQYPISPGCFSFNVADAQREFPAVFVYLGEVAEPYVKEKLSDLGHFLGEARRSLVVWYRHNGQLRYVCPDGLANIDTDLQESPKSIVRELST